MAEDLAALELRVYVELLGLPPERCPPNYFTLLAVSSATESAEVIQAAALSQAKRLRGQVPEELRVAARRVLKRVDRAQVCLSDTNARLSYINALREHRQAAPNSQDQTGLPPRSNESGTPRAKGVIPNLPASDASNRRSPVTSPSSLRPKTGSRKSPPKDQSHIDLPPLTSEWPANELLGTSAAVGPLKTLPKTPRQSQLGVYLSAAGLCGVVALVVTIGALNSGSETGGDLKAGADGSAATLPGDKSVQSVEQDVKQANQELLVPPIKPHIASASVANSSTANDTNPSRPISRIEDVSPSAVVESPRQRGRGSRASVVATAETPSRAAAAPGVAPASVIVEVDEPKQLDQLPALDDLVTEIDLPALRPAKTATSVDDQPAALALGEISANTAQRLQISVNQPTSREGSLSRFHIERAESKESAWKVHLTSTPPESGNADDKSSALDALSKGFTEPVAMITHDDEQLVFRWSNPKHANLAEQLRNCKLRLQADGAIHQMQLRTSKTIYKFIFDLSNRNVAFQIDDEHLPAPDTMHFQVSNVQLPGVEVTIDPESGLVKRGEILRLKLGGAGTPVELQFKFTTSDSRATVKFTPRYRLGSRWYYFTGGDVHGAIDDLHAAIDDGRARLASAESAASSLPGQISSAQAAVSADRQDYAVAKARLAQLRRALNSAHGTIRRMSNSLPEMSSKIPQLEQLVALGQKLHMQGSLEFRVYIPLEDGELELLKTGQENAPREEEKNKEDKEKSPARGTKPDSKAAL